MFQRLLVGLVLAASLAGCFGSSSGSSGSGSTGASANSTSGSVTRSAAPITLQGVPASSVVAGSMYSYHPLVTAGDGSLTFAIQGLPAWATFDSQTGVLSGTPTDADVGVSANITITASNGTATGSVGPFAILVIATASGTPAPSPSPTITGSPATTVTAGQTYSFQPVAADPSGKALTFSILNCPSWATFNTSSGLLTGTPTAAQAGTYANISINVSNNVASASLPVFNVIVVWNPPDAPTIAGSPAASTNVGQAYSFKPTASDPAGKSLTFAIANAPNWAQFNAATGALTGTPTVAGTFGNIVISVTDGTSTAELPPFTVTVNAVAADTPLIGGTPATSVAALQPYNFQPTASDPQGKPLTFAVYALPEWATFNTSTGALSGTPTAAQAGTYPGIMISVSNGSASASLPAFSIVVSNAVVATPPTIAGTPAGSVTAGSAYAFSPTTTDPSGGTLTFSVQNLPSWATFSSTTGAVAGTPTAAEVGTYANIVISVSDGKSSASLPAFTIDVTQSSNGSATLSWVAPTENTNGTPLTDLSGYTIYYGTNSAALTQTIQLTNPGLTSYVVTNLASGTWYFAVAANTSSGVQSALSGVQSKTL